MACLSSTLCFLLTFLSSLEERNLFKAGRVTANTHTVVRDDDRRSKCTTRVWVGPIEQYG